MTNIHRDGEGGAERRVVERHHRVEMQPPRLFQRERRTDDARRVADDERHFLRRAQRAGDEQIAFVLAVVVIGDNDDLAAGERGDGVSDTLVGVVHVAVLTFRRQRCAVGNGQAGGSPTWPRWRR